MKKNDNLGLALTTIIPIIAATSNPEIGNMLGITKAEPREVVLNHKERVKSGITHKQPKPGKNKPAKGYDPVTKTWQK